jgi:hypothetical protein
VSLTILAILSIVLGALVAVLIVGVFGVWSAGHSKPLPSCPELGTMGVPLFLLDGALAVAMFVVSGIGMLGGCNWARLLFLIGVPVAEVSMWIFAGVPQAQDFIGRIIVYSLALLILVKPSAAAYFAAVNERKERESREQTF